MYDANYVDSLRPLRSYDPRSTTSDPASASSFSSSSFIHLPLTSSPSVVPYFQQGHSFHPPTVIMKSPYYTRASDALIQINLLRSSKPVFSAYPPYVGMLPTGYPFDVVPPCQSALQEHAVHLAMRQQHHHHHPPVAGEQNLISSYSLEGSAVNPVAYSLEDSAVNPATALRVSPTKQDSRLNTSPLRDNSNPRSTKFHIVPQSFQRVNYDAHSLKSDSDPVKSRHVPIDTRLPHDTGSGASSTPGQTPHYPPHFNRGSVIQLAGGQLKRVEELQTSDFVTSAAVSENFLIDSSTVLHMRENHEHNTVILGFSVGDRNIQVTVEAMLEHPFFVFNQGWSSYSPELTLRRYGLLCQPLLVGDRCVSITERSGEPQNTGPQHPVGYITPTDLRDKTYSKEQPLISPEESHSNKKYDVTQVRDIRLVCHDKKVRDVMPIDNNNRPNAVRLSCSFQKKSSSASLAEGTSSSSPGIPDSGNGKNTILNKPAQTVTHPSHRISSCLKAPEISSCLAQGPTVLPAKVSLPLSQIHTASSCPHPEVRKAAEKDIVTVSRSSRKRRYSAPSCIASTLVADTFIEEEEDGEKLLRLSSNVLGLGKLGMFRRYTEVGGVLGSSSAAAVAPLPCEEEGRGLSCSNRSVGNKRCRMGHD